MAPGGPAVWLVGWCQADGARHRPFGRCQAPDRHPLSVPGNAERGAWHDRAAAERQMRSGDCTAPAVACSGPQVGGRHQIVIRFQCLATRNAVPGTTELRPSVRCDPAIARRRAVACFGPQVGGRHQIVIRFQCLATRNAVPGTTEPPLSVRCDPAIAWRAVACSGPQVGGTGVLPRQGKRADVRSGAALPRPHRAIGLENQRGAGRAHQLPFDDGRRRRRVLRCVVLRQSCEECEHAKNHDQTGDRLDHRRIGKAE